jgi:hypothetical protein
MIDRVVRCLAHCFTEKHSPAWHVNEEAVGQEYLINVPLSVGQNAVSKQKT